MERNRLPVYTPELGWRRLVFGSVAQVIEVPGEVISPEEAQNIDGITTAEQDAFEAESGRILEAQKIDPDDKDILLA